MNELKTDNVRESITTSFDLKLNEMEQKKRGVEPNVFNTARQYALRLLDECTKLTETTTEGGLSLRSIDSIMKKMGKVHSSIPDALQANIVANVWCSFFKDFIEELSPKNQLLDPYLFYRFFKTIEKRTAA